MRRTSLLSSSAQKSYISFSGWFGGRARGVKAPPPPPTPLLVVADTFFFIKSDHFFCRFQLNVNFFNLIKCIAESKRIQETCISKYRSIYRQFEKLSIYKQQKIKSIKGSILPTNVQHYSESLWLPKMPPLMSAHFLSQHLHIQDLPQYTHFIYVDVRICAFLYLCIFVFL